MIRRRGFALITAIAIIAVLGLIVAALNASISAQRDLSQQVLSRGEERLALQWAVEYLHRDEDLPTNAWGDLSVSAEVVFLAPNSPIYDHPALTQHYGDRLALVTIGEETRALLLRLGSPATHHILPRELAATAIPPQEESSL